MADIIYAQPQQSGFSLGNLVPLAIVAAIGIGAYYVLKNMGTSNGTSSQGTNTGPAVGPVTDNALSGSSAGGQAVSNANGTNGISDYIAQLTSALSRASGTPAVAANVAGIQAANVSTGQNTPSNFFPGGNNIVTYSETPTPAMITETLTNLARNTAGITNAWWQTPTITQTTTAGGVNSGGSFQSNIPVNTRHCSCTAALRANGVCGPNDDWYYC